MDWVSASTTFILDTLLTLCLLLFTAKVAGEICRRLGIAEVVGELLAGVIMAPTLLGGYYFLGAPLITVNDAVEMFAQLGAIMLLFKVGLEMRFDKFTRMGPLATMIAAGGVSLNFILGFALSTLWGYPQKEALLVGAALTATSAAITVKVLKDIGKNKTTVSDILVGSAVMDDILGLVVLAIVLGLVSNDSLDLVSIGFTTIKAVGVLAALMLIGVFVISKVINWLCPRDGCARPIDGNSLINGKTVQGEHCKIPCNGAQEATVIAMCFGYAYAAGMAGLSPILGAFAAGMSIAETNVLEAINEMTDKINFILAPLFFVVIGTYMNLGAISANGLLFMIALVVLAMLGKIVGCGLPVLLIRKNWKEAVLVGLGMMARGEVELIVGGVGITTGIFSQEVFSAIILLVVVTTVITPIALKQAYKILKVDN
ncbi:MAG TPA: cation:proton antiporter [Methanocella sp.]|uniref:cation:proton antiporter n=1 Tax=Methanocella sp. TaxID=2052833 RepID=UPI002C059310|nr:cation:proton antiporter [Methanocella sp.]HTY89609.1 cation:proton antiporter [Methanocella sp.]